MKWSVIALFVSVVFFSLWIWQMEHQTTESARSKLKLSLDRATHDAALQVDRDILAREGRVAFTSSSRTVFDNTLQTNLRFDANYKPIGNNLFNNNDRLEVLLYERVENGCPGSSGGFPCTYVNTTYGYVDTLRGPSIVAIIRMKHPRNYGISANKHFIVGSSHEYVGY